MNFITLDFETANGSRDSVCAIGLAKYENGILTDTLETLIDPEDYFDSYNVAVHGISEEMVIGSPTFQEFYDTMKDFIENQLLIAHFASFDISVLRHACDKYSLEYPNFEYSCTYQLSKKLLPGEINYKLNTLAKKFDIDFEHHNALDDAIACGKLLVNLFNESGTNDINKLLQISNLNLGKVFPGGYRGSRTKKKSTSSRISEITTNITEFDENHPFYKQTLVFTGALQSMVRKDAAQKAVDVGALCGNNVTKSTNFLIVGDYDLAQFGDGFKSSKMKRAEKLLSEGQAIEIVGESEFLKML